MKRRVLANAVTSSVLAMSLAIVGLHLEWNRSESAPLGLWREYPGRAPKVNEFVQFCMHPELALEVAHRAYAGGALGGPCPYHTWMLVKPVVAGPGDTVVHTPAMVSVNGKPLPLSSTRTRDGAGRAVPVARYGRMVLRPGEFWVHSPYADGSFDSRYVGVVDDRQVVGTARPLLTWTTQRQKDALHARGVQQ